MADRLVDLAFLAEGDAEVVVGVGVIRFQADGFLELADRLVGLAFLVEGGAEVVVGVGVIGFQADGFLELADRLVGLAFLVEGDAEVVVREVIVLRDCERMPEKGFTVLPIPELLPRQPEAQDDRRTNPPPTTPSPDTASAGSVRTRPRWPGSAPQATEYK